MLVLHKKTPDVYFDKYYKKIFIILININKILNNYFSNTKKLLLIINIKKYIKKIQDNSLKLIYKQILKNIYY